MYILMVLWAQGMDYVGARGDLYAHIGAYLPSVVVVSCLLGLKCPPLLHHCEGIFFMVIWLHGMYYVGARGGEGICFCLATHWNALPIRFRGIQSVTM